MTTHRVRVTSADRQERRRKHRIFRASFVIAYGLSYAADTILLSLFAALDTVPASIPIAYGVTGLSVCAGFYGLLRSGASERFRDPHLTILQTFSSCAVMLVFLGLAPQVGALFLSILLVVVGFGSLRLSWREALVSCLVIAAGTGVALHYGPGVSWFPSSTIGERSLVWLWYLLTLARLMGLGLVGNWMRVKLAKRGRQLTESIRALEARTEELHVAMAAAESASRAKSQFLANMSHEIRTPMNGVLGIAELLLESDLDETQRRHVQTMQDSGDVLLRIIGDILDFSKIEAGRVDLDPVETDVRHLGEEALQLAASGVPEKGIELACRVALDVPLRIRVDPVRLRQILLNLLGNAFKFTERGDVTLVIEQAGVAEVDAEPRQCLLRFSVRDSGIGVSPEARVRLFEPFSQADGSTTRRYGGTGLGLAVSKQLVEMMGGEIGAASRPGGGSDFWFTIRAEVVEGEPPAAPHVQEADALDCRGARVLLAEDNPVNRLVARAALENAGCRVTLAADGRAAVDAWLGQPFDLVIMDCQMPELDGFDATREIRLREAGAGARTPIVALTSSAMRGDRERCIAAGMDDYLSKPFKRSELAAVLRRWIDFTALPQTAETAAPLGAESHAPAQAEASTTDVPR